eukprot:TRINITY_DN1792_c0_g1_i8.p2 TRINITY_DN1792_c0_g1~~TRINITY_DN1792_c0_g1_i8.p2  ORF type:complete len:119 (+),score=19.42 TRINITY_DN1792_c0_g1_i8:65-421(+)
MAQRACTVQNAAVPAKWQGTPSAEMAACEVQRQWLRRQRDLDGCSVMERCANNGAADVNCMHCRSTCRTAGNAERRKAAEVAMKRSMGVFFVSVFDIASGCSWVLAWTWCDVAAHESI